MAALDPKRSILPPSILPASPEPVVAPVIEPRLDVRSRLDAEHQKATKMVQDLLQKKLTGEATSLTANVPDAGDSPVDTGGITEAAFNSALNKLLAASGGKVTVKSGKRSTARQAQLWADALKKYKDPEIADNWVARPGTSNHEKGLAADLAYADAAAKAWVHQHAAEFGLRFPMANEDWHIELLGGGGGSKKAQSAPTGKAGPHTTGDPNLDFIIGHESNWDPNAKNKTSSAFGIGQMIKSNREHYGKKLGFDPNTTDPAQQIAMMRAYVTDRYGSTEKAAAFKKANGWY